MCRRNCQRHQLKGILWLIKHVTVFYKSFMIRRERESERERDWERERELSQDLLRSPWPNTSAQVISFIWSWSMYKTYCENCFMNKLWLKYLISSLCQLWDHVFLFRLSMSAADNITSLLHLPLSDNILHLYRHFYVNSSCWICVISGAITAGEITGSVCDIVKSHYIH